MSSSSMRSTQCSAGTRMQKYATSTYQIFQQLSEKQAVGSPSALRSQLFRKADILPIVRPFKSFLPLRNVKFFSQERKQLGDKSTLERQIHKIIGIAIPALQGAPLCEFEI